MKLPLAASLLLLLPGAPMGAAATPAEQLLGVVVSEVTRPQNRCRWMAGELRHLESTLSLYRRDRPQLIAEVDGRPLADTTSLIRSSVFETRLLGPATATLTLHRPQYRRLSVRPGQQLGISLRDSRGRDHALFCGIVFDRRSQGREQIQVSALVPRAGEELRRSRRFTDMRRSEVISMLAQEAGLGVQIERTDSESVQATLTQHGIADWLFMSRLAAADDMQLTLRPEPLLHYVHSDFATPEPPPQRKFTELTWVDVVREIAQQEGLQTDMQVSATLTNSTFVQNQQNLLFAHDLAARHEHSAFIRNRVLEVVEDDIWRPNPTLAPDQRLNIAVDDLARRIARRHRLPLTVRVRRQRASALTRRAQTDSEFLFTTLAARGMHLHPGEGGLVLEPAHAPGDVADLLLSRVTVLAEGRAGRLTRSYGAVRDQLLDPLRVPGRTLTLELDDRTAGRDLQAARMMSRLTPTTLDLAAGDVSAAARALDDAIAEIGTPAEARERFLWQLAHVYRPTLLFVRRIKATSEATMRQPEEPVRRPRR